MRCTMGNREAPATPVMVPSFYSSHFLSLPRGGWCGKCLAFTIHLQRHNKALVHTDQQKDERGALHPSCDERHGHYAHVYS